MKTRTEITTEYAPCRQTKDGGWRPITLARYRSKIEAERHIEEMRQRPGASDSEKYKVMQRTAIVTIEEWQDI